MPRGHIVLVMSCLVACQEGPTATAKETPNPSPESYLLSIRPSGTGEGHVRIDEDRVCSALRGIWWGQCEMGVTPQTRITLAASAAPGSRFVGWVGGRCDPTQPRCYMDVTDSDTVSARFERTVPPPFMIEFSSHRPHPEWVARSLSVAASRWERVIVGDLRDVNLPEGVSCGAGTSRERVVDDVLVVVDAPDARIEGGGAKALICRTEFRDTAPLPAYGWIRIARGSRDSEAVFRTLAAHEIGHVLGIGPLFHTHGLVQGAGSPRAYFRGPGAMRAYGALAQHGRPQPVPLENDGGAGVAEVHWERDLIPGELMSVADGPLSILTVAALGDLGYTVDTTQVEGYRIDSPLAW